MEFQQWTHAALLILFLISPLPPNQNPKAVVTSADSHANCDEHECYSHVLDGGEDEPNRHADDFDCHREHPDGAEGCSLRRGNVRADIVFVLVEGLLRVDI